jgi:hypothetical protein
VEGFRPAHSQGVGGLVVVAGVPNAADRPCDVGGWVGGWRPCHRQRSLDGQENAVRYEWQVELGEGPSCTHLITDGMANRFNDAIKGVR